MYNWSLGVNEQSPINNACTGYSVILIQIMKPSKSLIFFDESLIIRENEWYINYIKLPVGEFFFKYFNMYSFVLVFYNFSIISLLILLHMESLNR